MSLADMVALVVDGEPGVTDAVCAGLVQDGCAVAWARPDPDADLGSPQLTSSAVMKLHVDVRDAASTKRMAQAVADRFGRIDILVNGGSYYQKAQRGTFDNITLAEWDSCFAYLPRGVWLCCRAVAPFMKERHRGHIITIGSTTPWSGAPGFLHYVTATSALTGITRSLARELGSFGISVNMVCLEPSAEIEKSLRKPDSENGFEVCQPALDESVKPADVAAAVLFLAGADSGFITGQSYLLNAGTWVQ